MFFVGLIIALTTCSITLPAAYEKQNTTPPYVAPDKTMRNHEAHPQDMAINGNTVVFAFFGNMVQISDIESCTHSLKKYGDDFNTILQFSSDGNILVKQSGEKIKMYNFPKQNYWTSISFKSLIGRCRLSRNGTFLLAESLKRLHLWDTQRGKELHEIEKKNIKNVLALSHDGNMYVIEDYEPSVHLVHCKEGKQTRLNKQPKFIDEALFSPKDPLLVLTAYFNSASKIYDTSTGTCVRLLPNSNQMRATIFSKDGNLLIGSQSNKKYGYCMRIWDPYTANIIHEFCCENRFPCHANTRHLALKSDKSMLAAGLDDGTIRLYTMPKKVIAFASKYLAHKQGPSTSSG